MLFRRPSRFVALAQPDGRCTSTSCCRATGGSRARPRAGGIGVALLQEDVDGAATRSPVGLVARAAGGPRLAAVYDARLRRRRRPGRAAAGARGARPADSLKGRAGTGARWPSACGPARRPSSLNLHLDAAGDNATAGSSRRPSPRRAPRRGVTSPAATRTASRSTTAARRGTSRACCGPSRRGGSARTRARADCLLRADDGGWYRPPPARLAGAVGVDARGARRRRRERVVAAGTCTARVGPRRRLGGARYRATTTERRIPVPWEYTGARPAFSRGVHWGKGGKGGGGAVGRGTCSEKSRAVMGARAGRAVPAARRIERPARR